jgi:large subunit ribosomal protein L25
MEQLDLAARIREEFGKGPSGRLRRSGFVPANLYGPSIEKNVPITLKTKEVEKVLQGHSAGNAIISLDVEGYGKKTVMFKELQLHPARDTIEHIDLIEVLMDQKVIVEVPLTIVGKSEGVAIGGILQQESREIKVECLPSIIPDSIDVDVTRLGIGQSLHVGDIVLPEGLVSQDDATTTIVSVVAPTVEAEVKTAEEVEAELAESFEEKEGEEEVREGEKEEGKKEEKKEEEKKE